MFGLGVLSLALTWVLAAIVLLIIGAFFRRQEAVAGGEHCWQPFGENFSPHVAVGIAIFSLMYFLFYGVCDEVPADLYQHLTMPV